MSHANWFHNAITGEIISYEVDSNGDIWSGSLKGHLRAYDDYITTGLKTREKAIEWANTWGPCKKCKSARPVGKCKFCGEDVPQIPIKIYELD